MIYHIENTAKYLLLFVFLFFSLFFVLFSINILPAFSGGMVYSEVFELSKSIIIPVFYYSFYNAVVLSVFLYGFLLVKNEHIHKISVRAIPMLLTFIFILPVSIFLKPDYDDVNFSGIDDARLFVDEGIFFNYINEVPPVITSEIFDKLMTSADNKEKNIIRTNYLRNLSTFNYVLNKNANTLTLDKIRTIFFKYELYDDIKIYIGKSGKSKLTDVVAVFNNEIIRADSLNARFIEQQMYLDLEEYGKPSLVFFRKSILVTNRQSYSLINNLIVNNHSIVSMFLSDKIINRLIAWFLIVYLLITASSLIYTGNFPFISMILNFLLLIFIYNYTSNVYLFLKWFFENITPEKINNYRYIITFFIFIIPAGLFNFIRAAAGSHARRVNV